MNRRDFLRATGGLAATGVAGAHAAEAVAADGPKAFGFASPPVLVNPGADEVTVVFAVSGPGTGWVEFGQTEALGSRAGGGEAGMMPYSENVVRVVLRGLRPGTRYFYRAHACPVDFRNAYTIKRGAEVRGETGSFRTLDPAAAGATFTVWNDTHENADTLRALAGKLRDRPGDFLVWNGDVTNDLNDEKKIAGQFLHPGGQAIADRVPLFLGRGNHDVRGRYARRLPGYLTGPGGRYHYTFRHGPVAGLVMDTGEDKPDEMPVYAGLNDFAAYRTEQAAWLETAIADPRWTSAAYRVAFLHIPLIWEADVPERWTTLYGPGVKGWVCTDGFAKWHDLFVRGKVDLVVSGHTHRHAWFPPRDGRPYGQLIGGGPRPEQATVIEGSADARRLEVVMRKLDGEVLEKAAVPAKA